MTRNTAIESATDPFGKKWGVAHEGQTALYYIGHVKEDDYNEGEELVTKPNTYPATNLQGHFTKPDNAKTEIRKWLVESWNASDEAAKNQPGKERAKLQKAEEEKEVNLG
jgi:hypothetical protein|tara:strand:- start:2141 stop:2470 length:330 start_codon:yes stop_codon:yes gene_type:complete